MKRRAHWLSFGPSFAIPFALAACLPKDTRPVPATLEVTATADPLLLGGTPATTTVDGWSVSYDRFLIGIGASLDGDTTCADYYRDGYQRVLDMSVPGPQKVNTLFSLGRCDVGFRVSSPDPFPAPPLGENVTQADLARMITPGTDPYTAPRNGTPQPSGVALYVRGSATRDAVTKTFEWSFRRRLRYQNCAAPLTGDAGSEPSPELDASTPVDAAVDAAAVPRGPQGVDLTSHGAVAIDVRIHGEALFLDSAEPFRGELRFDVLAAADDDYGDHDGAVTLTELHAVPLADVTSAHRYLQPRPTSSPGGPPATSWTTLEDFVYLGLFPRVARYEDRGTCTLRGPRTD